MYGIFRICLEFGKRGLGRWGPPDVLVGSLRKNHDDNGNENDRFNEEYNGFARSLWVLVYFLVVPLQNNNVK